MGLIRRWLEALRLSTRAADRGAADRGALLPLLSVLVVIAETLTMAVVCETTLLPNRCHHRRGRLGHHARRAHCETILTPNRSHRRLPSVLAI